jgi:hypothetical protein
LDRLGAEAHVVFVGGNPQFVFWLVSEVHGVQFDQCGQTAGKSLSRAGSWRWSHARSPGACQAPRQQGWPGSTHVVPGITAIKSDFEFHSRPKAISGISLCMGRSRAEAEVQRGAKCGALYALVMPLLTQATR